MAQEKLRIKWKNSKDERKARQERTEKRIKGARKT